MTQLEQLAAEQADDVIGDIVYDWVGDFTALKDEIEYAALIYDDDNYPNDHPNYRDALLDTAAEYIDVANIYDKMCSLPLVPTLQEIIDIDANTGLGAVEILSRGNVQQFIDSVVYTAVEQTVVNQINIGPKHIISQLAEHYPSFACPYTLWAVWEGADVSTICAGKAAFLYLVNEEAPDAILGFTVSSVYLNTAEFPVKLDWYPVEDALIFPLKNPTVYAQGTYPKPNNSVEQHRTLQSIHSIKNDAVQLFYAADDNTVSNLVPWDTHIPPLTAWD